MLYTITSLVESCALSTGQPISHWRTGQASGPVPMGHQAFLTVTGNMFKLCKVSKECKVNKVCNMCKESKMFKVCNVCHMYMVCKVCEVCSMCMVCKVRNMYMV